ncbi:MAG: hypothetical protein AAFX92_04245 [Pseudomonadota bacterium]
MKSSVLVTLGAVIAAGMLLSACASSGTPKNSADALAEWRNCVFGQYDDGRITMRGNYVAGMTHERAVDVVVNRCFRELDRYERALVAEGMSSDEAEAEALTVRGELRNYLIRTTRSSQSTVRVFR